MQRGMSGVVLFLALLPFNTMTALGDALRDASFLPATQANADPSGKDKDPDRWWPIQAMPRGIVRTRGHNTFAEEMLVQSMAGLAAKAVNQTEGDELVWVTSGNINLEAWYQTFLEAHPTIQVRGTLDPWELVDRYAKKGIIKGYILYAQDRSKGRLNEHRKGMDLSVNVATSLVGILGGVLIEESLETKAQAQGLSLLLDARGKTQAWCFETYKDRFNRKLLCAQDPKKPHIRDLAIAQEALVLYGPDEPMESALKWLEPLSPIVGWNGGDEFETTRLSSLYGHIQTATDWCMNLPVLMAGSERVSNRVTPDFDSRKIDWNDRRSCVSFILTDGDNVQWLETSFFRGNPSYWANPDRGRIPFGWSCCFGHLAQVCPAALDHALATKKEKDQFIEWGAGYYYPDLFAHSRPNPEELLARHARRTWQFMKQTGTRIIAYNVQDASSPDALKAYQTIAQETDGVSAILVFQYSAYEAGAGQTFWVKDKRGVEVPVIAARYSIWENANHRARSGTPAKVAREIRESATGKTPRYDWVNVHAWSYFRQAPGADEDAENLPQTKAQALGGVRGYTAALWCSERLPENVRVVSPEELAWRIRMDHDPGVTKKLLDGQPLAD